MMEKIDKNIVIVAIVCLAVMQIFAMHYGINGTLRTIIVGVIAALAGLTIPSEKLYRRL